MLVVYVSIGCTSCLLLHLGLYKSVVRLCSLLFQNCWNCGRKANETCSGCNLARYCGAFCQHKDWENHHRVCGQQMPKSADDAKKIPTSTATSGKESGKLTPSPGLNRPKIASPTRTADPITSLSDYVRKTPSTWYMVLEPGNDNKASPSFVG